MPGRVGEHRPVAVGDARGHAVGEQPGDLGVELRGDGDAQLDSHVRSNARFTVSWSSLQLTSNFSSPSVSSTLITSA